MDQEQIINHTVTVVTAYVANNSISPDEAEAFMRRVHATLTSFTEPAPQPMREPKTPAISVRASVKQDYLVCLECGQQQKMLKRHLQNAHDMSPQQYRAEYGLPREYPMVAASYSEKRRSLAHSIGLGRNDGKTGRPRSKSAAPTGKASSAGKG